MRPVRITGVTGTSVPVPLDTYALSPASVVIETTGTGEQLQFTTDNVFDTTITAQWQNLGAAAAAASVATVAPMGARAVRCTGMVPADVLSVSQQGIR
jgi:hypothetical protein